MATEGPAIMLPGVVAGSGLEDTVSPSVQFKFVKFSADKTVVLCSALTDIPCGVLQAPSHVVGDAVTVMALGISKVRLASASPTAGAIIGPDANGDAAVAVFASTSMGGGTLLAANAGGAVAEGVYGTAAIDCCAPGRCE